MVHRRTILSINGANGELTFISFLHFKSADGRHLRTEKNKPNLDLGLRLQLIRLWYYFFGQITQHYSVLRIGYHLNVCVNNHSYDYSTFSHLLYEHILCIRFRHVYITRTHCSWSEGEIICWQVQMLLEIHIFVFFVCFSFHIDVCSCRCFTQRWYACSATEQPDFLNPEPHATAVYTDAFTQLHVLSRITLSQHVFERKTQ